MSRGRSDHRSARTRTAVVLAMAVSLLAPAATAFADQGGPPEGSGRSLTSSTQASCGAASCSSITFDAKEVGAARSVCVDILTTSLDGATIYQDEYGCSFDNLGAWRSAAGFITGVAATTVSVADGLGATRDVVVSAATKLAGAVMPSTEIQDGSDATCTITWTIKERRVAVAGTVTVDGLAYATGSDSLSTIRTVKEKSSC